MNDQEEEMRFNNSKVVNHQKNESTSHEYCAVEADVALLTKIKGSKLEEYVNSQIHKKDMNQLNSIEIDLEPEVLEHMISYLHSDRQTLPKNLSDS